MAIIQTWLWRNVIWRLKGEGSTFDDHFRGSCKTTFFDTPRLAGNALDRFQVQALCMAPRDSTIVVKQDGNDDFRFEVHHPTLIRRGAKNEFLIKKDPATGELYFYIEYVYMENGPKGFGAVAFLRCAQMCQMLGFERIDLLAAGGKSYKIQGNWNPGFNGYYTWGRFGFNAPLHPQTIANMQAEPALVGANDLLEVMERNAQWWKDEGGGGHDLRLA